MDKIFVTKSFLPPLEEYTKYLEEIWQNNALTNQGPLLLRFQETIRSYLQVEHFHYLANGTLSLQLALAALDIHEGEIITTPFSYVATSSAILWQKCKPVFVDIEPENFTIDSSKIEKAITKNTKAILAVHVFGYACQVDKLQEIADKHSLTLVYDGAHAFASKYKDKSLLDYGDISTLSFHATKLFHTVEGGACIAKSSKISEKLELLKRFGHQGNAHYFMGINAKASEFHAAMGLTNFPYISQIVSKRKKVSENYDSLLNNSFQRPKMQEDLDYNYAYYPILFESEQELEKAFIKLNSQNIFPRRYFNPSLNTLSYVDYRPCPISEDIASRIACLPLYPDLGEEEISTICKLLLSKS